MDRRGPSDPAARDVLTHIHSDTQRRQSGEAGEQGERKRKRERERERARERERERERDRKREGGREVSVFFVQSTLALLSCCSILLPLMAHLDLAM